MEWHWNPILWVPSYGVLYFFKYAFSNHFLNLHLHNKSPKIFVFRTFGLKCCLQIDNNVGCTSYSHTVSFKRTKLYHKPTEPHSLEFLGTPYTKRHFTWDLCCWSLPIYTYIVYTFTNKHISYIKKSADSAKSTLKFLKIIVNSFFKK